MYFCAKDTPVPTGTWASTIPFPQRWRVHETSFTIRHAGLAAYQLAELLLLSRRAWPSWVQETKYQYSFQPNGCLPDQLVNGTIHEWDQSSTLYKASEDIQVSILHLLIKASFVFHLEFWRFAEIRTEGVFMKFDSKWLSRVRICWCPSTANLWEVAGRKSWFIRFCFSDSWSQHYRNRWLNLNVLTILASLILATEAMKVNRKEKNG